MVCMYSGLEHGPEHTEEHFDLNGGTGRKTGDPDVNCGESMNGRWTKRIDPVQASRQAFAASKSLCEGGTFPTTAGVAECSELCKKSYKRAARCISEEAGDDPGVKKRRAGKKNTASDAVRVNLMSEAENVILKMVDHKRVSSYKHCVLRDSSRKECANAQVQDDICVFYSVLKRYVNKCVSQGVHPSLDTIHGLSIMAKTASEQAVADRNKAALIEAVRTVKFRTSCSALIVALWSAVCATPYMKSAKQGSDAYRPFVCGALYAFKRGLSLPNGTVLLPRCPQLALALPVLRGTGGNTAARTLHSSSHRGMCTLSRCIASVPLHEQSAFFASVARISMQFASHNFSTRDV